MLSTSAAAIRGQALAPQQRRAGAAARPARGAALQTQALFSFLAPPKAKAANNRAKELVDELLAASERTQGGLNVSPARRCVLRCRRAGALSTGRWPCSMLCKNAPAQLTLRLLPPARCSRTLLQRRDRGAG